MEALRQILKIPRDHELKIKIPQNILENETVEVILIIENREEKFRHKINEMKKAVKDERFMDDLKNVSKDFEAVDAIKKARLHRKVATAIFFESNGGQSITDATMPEIRLAVAEPGLDLGNIETVLETLGESCYYLRVERNRYRFGLTVTLNKIFSRFTGFSMGWERLLILLLKLQRSLKN